MMTGKTMDMGKQIQIERSARCREIGKKYGALFGIVIFEVIAFVILQVIMWSGVTSASLPVIYGSSIAILLVALGVSILYAVTVFSLGKYYDGFKSAGMIYVLYQGISAFSYTIFGFGRVILSFIASVLGIIYIMSFSSAVEESFELVDTKMASTWARFRKVFLLLQAVQFLSLLFVGYASGRSFSRICLLVMTAAGVILRLWQFILLGESSSAMDKYVNSPT